jgi:AcrR family transcriptional regulator
MAKKADPEKKVLEAALALAGERGWPAVTVTAVADRAGLGPDEVFRYAPGRQGFLDLLGRKVDEAALAEGAVDAEEPARDRLFEVLMRRFDYLQDHREGILAIASALRSDPVTGFRQIPALERSMALMLDLAGMPARGLIGQAKIRVLSLIYLDLARTWMRDDSEDMAVTMKALDKRLDQAEQLANTFERGRPPRRRKARPDEANGGDREAEDPAET